MPEVFLDQYHIFFYTENTVFIKAG